MSKENTEFMVAPESSVSPRHLQSTSRRASASGSFRAGNNVTRSSTGKSNSANSIQSVNSRYLRASTGSCHDFCKFGHRHFSEEKTRVPLYTRVSKPSHVKMSPVGRTTLEEQKNVNVLNHEPPSNTKARSTPYMKSELRKTKTPLNEEKSIKQKPSTDSINDDRKPKTFSDVKTSFSSQTSTRLPKNIPSSTKKVSSSDPPEMIKSVIFPSENVQAKVKCVPSSAREIPRYGRQKASPSAKSNPVNAKPVLRSKKSDVVPGTRSKNMKRLAPQASSLIPKASLEKPGSTNRLIKAGNLKPIVQDMVNGDNGNTSNGEQIFERTFHLTEAEKDAFGSLPDDHIIPCFSSPSPSMQSHEEEDSKEIDYGNKYLEVGEVPFIPAVASITYFPHSPKSLSRPASSPSSLCPHEEVNNEIGNFGSLGMDEELSVPHVQDVSLIPYLPKSLLQAATSPHCIVNGEEIENLYKEQGEITISSEQSLENDTVDSIRDHSIEPHKCISENDESPEIQPHECISENDGSLGIGNTQSIPEITKWVGYRDDEYDPKIDESAETGNFHSSCEVTEGIEEGCVSENNASPDPVILQSIPDDANGTEHPDNGYTSEKDDPQRAGILQFISEAKKGIESYDNGYISRNNEYPEIHNKHPVPGNTIPSSPEYSYIDSSLSSCEDNEDDAEYTDSELDEYNTEKDENPTSNAPRRTRVLTSDENHSNPVKLKFRPGRTVDLQSENTGPRRLRFRRRRVLEIGNVNGETKSLKKSEAVNNGGGDETSSERVVLKHQDVQDKKDSQVLLNNVIEETASKLVESRKSKVKALVGAFETVISLQETKPGS